MYDCGFTKENNWFRYRAAAIIVENDCVLFAGNENEDYFYSIGGGVHMGETAENAVLREVTHRLDTVLDKFLKTMQTTTARLQEKLLKPEVRQKGKEQVKEKARDSVLQLLSRLQAEQAQRNPSALSTAEKSENRFQ